MLLGIILPYLLNGSTVPAWFYQLLHNTPHELHPWHPRSWPHHPDHWTPGSSCPVIGQLLVILNSDWSIFSYSEFWLVNHKWYWTLIGQLYLRQWYPGDRILVFLQSVEQLALPSVPDLDGVIKWSWDELVSVRYPLHTGHVAHMITQLVHQGILLVGNIPDDDIGVHWTRRKYICWIWFHSHLKNR